MKTIISILFCLSVLLVTSCTEKDPPPEPSPPEVSVFQTESQDVPIHREYVGQIYGFKDIAVRARVEGFLEGIHFKEGARVEKGALLYVLESQPFDAKVAAQMSMVTEAKTMQVKAQSDLNRYRPLAEQKAVSQSDLDAAVAQYEAASASVDAAKANLQAANIQLGYTKIYAPVSGIIGKTEAKVGDFVGRDPNPVILNTVSQIDTILVQFFITETEYLRFVRNMLSAEADPASKKSGKATLQLILADDSIYKHPGKVDFVDRQVDSATGSLLLQASFPNPDKLLRPGQFAKIKAKVKIIKDGILIPQRCVTELQSLYSVYIVDNSNKTRQRKVTMGPKIGQFWLVTEGLKTGEKVVYEGLQKVKDGTTVKPVVQTIPLTSQESK